MRAKTVFLVFDDRSSEKGIAPRDVSSWRFESIIEESGRGVMKKGHELGEGM